MGGLIKIAAVCGPTGCGKTRLAIDIANAFNGEIINADSVKVYKGFDIGTAKPDEAERAEARFHLIDAVEPSEHFDGGVYMKLADEAVADVVSRGKLPVIEGGTGMYIGFLLNGISPSPKRDEGIRAYAAEKARECGAKALYDELANLDPDYAAKISPNDLHRIVRALEVCRLTGAPFSQSHKKHDKSKRYDYVALTPKIDRRELYARLDARFDDMMRRGLLNEVKELYENESTRNSRPMESIGYKELSLYLSGEKTLDEAVNLAKIETRHYAKRQTTWFKKQPEGVMEVEYPPLSEYTLKIIEEFLEEKEKTA